MLRPEVKAEAVRLRVEERLSIDEIRQRLQVSQGSVSQWLRSYPLTAEEVRQRHPNGPPPAPRKPRGVQSDLHRLAVSLGVAQTSAWKGRVAEAAVLFRLVLRGFEPLRAVFEGDCVDWFVRIPSGRIVRLQVKWASEPTQGQPFVSLEKAYGGGKKRRRYEDGKLDCVIGYDLFTDTAYVWGWSEVRGRSMISVCPDAVERWDKLLQGVA